VTSVLEPWGERRSQRTSLWLRTKVARVKFFYPPSAPRPRAGQICRFSCLVDSLSQIGADLSFQVYASLPSRKTLHNQPQSLPKP
jgi:hypothetical protein